MADKELPEYLKRRMANEAAWATPDTIRGRELHAESIEQDGILGNVGNALADSAAASGFRRMRDEGTRIAEDLGYDAREEPIGFNEDTFNAIKTAPLLFTGLARSLLGERHGNADYDKDREYSRLTDGIPVYMHDEIMSDSLASAERARSRILTDIARGERIAGQKGMTSTLALLAGSLVDVDMPLTFMTGGGFKAALVAGRANKMGRAIGLGETASSRLASAAVGANSGLQAGIVVGAAGAGWSETKDWTSIGEVALQATLMGAVGNAALHGDRELLVHAAQRELHEKVARNDRSLYEPINAEAGQTNPIFDHDEPFELDETGNPIPTEDGYFVEAGQLDKQSVGAALNPAPGPNYYEEVDKLVDPMGSISSGTKKVIARAREWRDASGFAANKEAASHEFMTRIATHPAFNLANGDWNRMYLSGSATLNFIAGQILESSNGLGRGQATSAILKETFVRRVMSPFSAVFQSAKLDWAKRNNSTLMNSGFFINGQGSRQFDRETLLEMNDRHFGRISDARDPAIRAAADGLEASGTVALNIGKGEGGTPIDGFADIQASRGWMPRSWSGQKIMDLIAQGVATKKDIIRGLALSYKKAGSVLDADAKAMAKAVVHRAMAKESDIDLSMASLMTRDGQEYLRSALIASGMKPRQVEGLMTRFVGKRDEAGKEGFAKRRSEIDLSDRIPTRDGSNLQIVDLLDHDIQQSWSGYSRQLSGAAALARNGLNNRARRTDLISAIHAEQRALGEEIFPAEHLNAIFSHFDGGPVHGYSRGVANAGIGEEIGLVKRLTNLALLNKMAIPQLIETSAAIAQQGLTTWFHRGPLALWDAEMRAANKELLAEASYLIGDIGQDHLHFAPHLQLDEMSRAEANDWVKKLGKFAGNLQMIQGYTSLFNQLRGWQQRQAVLGMTDRVMRDIKAGLTSGNGLDPKQRRRFNQDLGLSDDDIRRIERLIQDGTIEFKKRGEYEYVNRLNMDKWGEHSVHFAAAMSRNVSQVVMDALAGERSAWMGTWWGSLMTHLKTFPLLAIQKSFVRNMRHMDAQSLANLGFGMATAFAVLGIRDVIDGKERTVEERARLAFSYANITGWMPMAWDPAMSALGLEDYRINPYGQTSNYTPAAMTWFNKATRLPGAVVNTITGNADYHDIQTVKALPYGNAFGLSRVLDGIPD